MSLTKAVKLAFQRLAPLELAESWDNVGLLLEPFVLPTSQSKGKRKVLLATDLTKQIVESMPDDIGSLVVYHPTIFRGLKSLTQEDALQSCILQCAAKGISIYSPHSCLDAADEGIQNWNAKALGEGKWQNNSPKPRVWKLNQPTTLDEVVDRIKKHLDMPTYKSRHHATVMKSKADSLSAAYALMLAKSQYGKKDIQTVGLCPGSGGSFLSGSEADLWWTGELGHHEVLATVAAGTHVVLCTHTATERPYLKHFFRAKLEETLNAVREEEKLDDQPYSVVMCEEHEKEVLQFV